MEDDAAIEARRLEELRQIKRATLHELDKQAAQYTRINVPPHIQTERERLRRELGMVESVIASPLGASIGDELGESGRFVAYLEQVRQVERSTLEAVARIEESFQSFIRDRFEPSERNSMQWRRLGTWAFILIIIIIVIMALVGMFWLGRLSDGQAMITRLFVWR